jgi:low affinity Fe/Cu permease
LIKRWFVRFTDRTTDVLGSPWATLAAILVIVVWAATGPIFGFSEPWQLVINTGTTVVTFVMVFVIQAAQNRSDKATHLKLDEILKWMNDRTEPEEALGAEKRTEEEIEQIQAHLHSSG